MTTQAKQVLSSLAIFSMLVGVTLSFQNCGTDTSTGSAFSQNQLGSPCLGGDCQVDAGSIQLSIGNQEPISLKVPTFGGGSTGDCSGSRCFDIGGFCDDGGWGQSAIYIELKGPTGFTMKSAGTGCSEMGRFRVLVRLPANFDYLAAHSAVLTLFALDEDGQAIENPTGLHRKEISIVGVP